MNTIFLNKARCDFRYDLVVRKWEQMDPELESHLLHPKWTVFTGSDDFILKQELLSGLLKALAYFKLARTVFAF
jgi:hypothetical protein